MLKILTSSLRLGAVRVAAKKISNNKPIFSLILAKKSSVNIIQQRSIGSYAEYKKTNPYNVRNLFNTWGRVPFIRIAVTPSKIPLKRFWSWSAALSLAMYIPILDFPVTIALAGFAVNVYRDKILSPSVVNAHFLPAYKSERIITLLKDGLWTMIPPVIIALFMSIPAVLFQGTSALTFALFSALPFFSAFLLAFFSPLMAAYALVNQDQKNKWISIFSVFDTRKVRKIWRSLGPIGRQNYKQAALSAFVAFFLCFIVTTISVGIMAGPAFLWSYLTVAEMFGDLLSKEQHKLRD